MYSVSIRLTFELTDDSVVDTLGPNSRFDKCVTQRGMERSSSQDFRAALLSFISYQNRLLYCSLNAKMF